MAVLIVIPVSVFAGWAAAFYLFKHVELGFWTAPASGALGAAAMTGILLLSVSRFRGLSPVLLVSGVGAVASFLLYVDVEKFAPELQANAYALFVGWQGLVSAAFGYLLSTRQPAGSPAP